MLKRSRSSADLGHVVVLPTIEHALKCFKAWGGHGGVYEEQPPDGADDGVGAGWSGDYFHFRTQMELEEDGEPPMKDWIALLQDETPEEDEKPPMEDAKALVKDETPEEDEKPAKDAKPEENEKSAEENEAPVED